MDITKSRKSQEAFNFINANIQNETVLKDYFDKCFENTKEAIKQEDKLSLWLIVVIFLSIVFMSKSVESASIVGIGIKDFSKIIAIMPVMISYILMRLWLIARYIQENTHLLKMYSYSIHIQKIDKYDLGEKISKTTKPYLPFSMYNLLTGIIDEKPKISESIIGFMVLLPNVLLGIIPYYIWFSTVKYLWEYYYGNTFVILCVFVSICLISVNIFAIVVISRQENKKDREYIRDL
ncbi:hypothetical protein [Flavobacterium silvaticum]|uniref:Uncharacterized protein n=1 Tax=Flavobacterium silvaticum TaxID=1852020 RepID=A0A972FM16_9FLAO|nr:hypothetical protein [Flavobacterium silvaticum]NMH28486.1 hypothetical protein [Flavobacterium silvaticum]